MSQLAFFYGSQPAPSPAESIRRGKSAKRDGKKRVESIENAQCQMILRHIRGYPNAGRTRQEIADDLDLKVSSVCGRVNALINAKKVYVEGRRNGQSVVFPVGY